MIRWAGNTAGALALLAAASGGCQRDGGSDEDGAESGVTGDPTEGEPMLPAGPMPLRRLNQQEFNNTIRDLLGDASRPADGFTPDSPGESGFVEAPTVTSVPARDLMRAAEEIALRAVADLGELIPCDLQGDELGCVEAWVASFGKRAFRRPLAQEEVDELVGLYTAARGELKLELVDSVSLLLQVMLQSPRFLYRWELGTGTPEVGEEGTIALGEYELASRLSYFLWATMPDDALMAAADAGELRDPEALRAQAERMLADPKARDVVFGFHMQWLGLMRFGSLEMDPLQFPQYTVADMKQSMLDQLYTFTNHVVFDAGGKLDLLLAADYTFADVRLGNSIYYQAGLTEELAEITYDPAQRRAGVLGLPIVMASHAFFASTSPVKRGKLIRERLLCETIPPPPSNANNSPPKSMFGTTTRQVYDAMLLDENCAGCHALMNPLGYAFENLNQLGRWRVDEYGEPIDASGYIAGVEGEPTFTDQVGLATLLADSDQVRACMATQWLRFALQRREIPADQESLDGIFADFEASEYDIRALIIAVATSPAFRTRVASEGEVLQ